jgi:undecaprenyl-phosphate 4-deoxy-4-formamido-L-arabinose transferase
MLSIIIPVYRGEKTIKLLFSEILQTFKEQDNIRLEIIFVYDCGGDDSWQIIKEIVSNNKDIARGVRLSRNFGQHNALICGFENAKGDFAVTIDEDLQQDPDDILRLIKKQKENDYDVVYGKFIELKHSSFRNRTSNILKKLIKWGIPNLHPDYSALRLIKKEIYQVLPKLENSYTFLDGYITWITSNVASTPVKHNNRRDGKSSYNIRKLVEHSINIFVTFSNLPIRILTFSSVLAFLATIVYSAVIVYQRIVGQISIPGYASLIIAIGLGVGLILLGLGVIGEYIYRINLKTTRRPNYISVEKKEE